MEIKTNLSSKVWPDIPALVKGTPFQDVVEAVHWRANHVGSVLEGILNSKHTPPANRL